MLADIFLVNKSRINSVLKISIGVVLISAMAQIVLPVYPVPVTLQTVASILIGLLYRPTEAFFTWLSYLILGALGMPIFLGFSSGIAKFTGPTAGYLIGMLVAAVSMSYIRHKFDINVKKTVNIFSLIIFGQILIYSFGVAWLSHLIGFDKAIYSGLVVFIPSGIVKSLILATIFKVIYAKTN